MLVSGSAYVGKAMTQESVDFSSFNFSAPLMKALEAIGFQTPSPVQSKTIPILLEGRDVIAQAQTGTGKTAAFVLPILQRLARNATLPQALVLAPTRELAIQVAEQFEILSKFQKVPVAVLCGGQDYRWQLKRLREGAPIVVGTPGRILDHLERGTLQLGELSTFVLDEADEMLRMGFIEDVEAILAKIPNQKQIALFSATMPHRIRQIANSYLTDPVTINIQAETATVKSIDQRFLFASPVQKPEALRRIFALESYQGAIVFVRTKSSTEEVAESLRQAGHRAIALHGDISQALREKIIMQFRQGSHDILVATDVAARGLDVDRVTHVINYDVPHDCETYVHRIGRTGRAGRTGVTILFVSPRESRILNLIERHTRQRIQKISVPTDPMIQAAKAKRFMENIQTRLQHKHLADYQSMMNTFLEETQINAAEAAAALALWLNQDQPWQTVSEPYPQSEQANKGRRSSFSEKRGRGNDRDRGGEQRDFARQSPKKARTDYPQTTFRMDVGRVHGVKPSNIVGAIANEGGLDSRYITGIKIHDDHSIVCLPQTLSKEVVRDLMKAWVCGRQLNLTAL